MSLTWTQKGCEGKVYFTSKARDIQRFQAVLKYYVEQNYCTEADRQWLMEQEDWSQYTSFTFYHPLPFFPCQTWLCQGSKPTSYRYQYSSYFSPATRQKVNFTSWIATFSQSLAVLPTYRDHLKTLKTAQRKKKRQIDSNRRQVLNQLFREGDQIPVQVSRYYACNGGRGQGFKWLKILKIGLTITGVLIPNKVQNEIVAADDRQITLREITLRAKTIYDPQDPNFSQTLYLNEPNYRTHYHFYPFRYLDYVPLLQAMGLNQYPLFRILQYLGLLGSIPRAENPLKTHKKRKIR